jgi:hypothetical protein
MDLDSFTVNFGVKYRTAIQMTHQIGKVSFKTLVFFCWNLLKELMRFISGPDTLNGLLHRMCIHLF